MKKIVWTFGLISGAIMGGMFLITIPFKDKIGFDRGMIIGYTSMVLAGLLITFGIRAYRDNIGGGRVSFRRAMGVGSLIALVASGCYVAMWEVVYYNFMPDYLEHYQAYALEKSKAKGATQAELDKEQAEMKRFAKLYQNPVINAGMTLMEPLPVQLIIVLLSAGVLSRRTNPSAAG